MPARLPYRHIEREILNDNDVNEDSVQGLQERQNIINRYFIINEQVYNQKEYNCS